MSSELLRSFVPPVEDLKMVGPIFDVETYLNSGQHALANLRKFAYLTPNTSVLDVGCGFGRVAIQLTQFLKPESRYLGFDVVQREIDWCSKTIAPKYPNFEFRHLDAFNKMYNPSGFQKAADMKLPVDSASFDLTFLFSVFTHMLPADIETYLREIFRCLKPNGVLFASFFLITEESKASIAAGKSQFAFQSTNNGYYITHVNLEEAAIAYDDFAVFSMLRHAGFKFDKVIFGGWSGKKPSESGQEFIVCSKP